mgnify:CR=1 FL=1
MRICPKCGCELVLTITPEKIHYGRLDCPTCKKFYGWEKKPASTKNRSFGEKGCSFCPKGFVLVQCSHCGRDVCESCAYEFGDIWLCPDCGEKESEKITK